MNTLRVPKIALDHTVTAEQIPALLDEKQVPFHQIGRINWEAFPYKPEAGFRIAHTGDSILLHYRVTEESVRAVAPCDNGRVWEDSCAEFFIQFEEEGGRYYNLECNCAGTLLVEYGVPGGREHAPLEAVSRVERWSSLGRCPFEERKGTCSWQLALLIPLPVFFRHRLQTLDGMEAKANFYKCGDKQQTPHFLSWNPIDLPSPCFHCPEFFGRICFDASL